MRIKTSFLPRRISLCFSLFRHMCVCACAGSYVSCPLETRCPGFHKKERPECVSHVYGVSISIVVAVLAFEKRTPSLHETDLPLLSRLLQCKSSLVPPLFSRLLLVGFQPLTRLLPLLPALSPSASNPMFVVDPSSYIVAVPRVVVL
jgi:hypothetical protein